MRVRAVLLAVPALLAGPAAPASAHPVPIAGGGSFNAARTVRPGTYEDTVRSGRSAYYAVDLRPGQRLHVSLTSRAGAATFAARTDALRVVAFGPLRNELPRAHAALIMRGARAGFTTQPAGQDEVADGGTPLPGPGRYYVVVSSSWVRPVAPPPAELPVTLTVRVTGRGAAATSAPASATPAPEPTITSASDSDRHGTSPLLLAGAAIAGLLAGAAAATALRRRPAALARRRGGA